MKPGLRSNVHAKKFPASLHTKTMLVHNGKQLLIHNDNMDMVQTKEGKFSAQKFNRLVKAADDEKK